MEFQTSPYDNVQLLYIGTTLNGLRVPPPVTIQWTNPTIMQEDVSIILQSLSGAIICMLSIMATLI
jgi:hypothetical protein